MQGALSEIRNQRCRLFRETVDIWNILQRGCSYICLQPCRLPIHKPRRDGFHGVWATEWNFR